MERNNINDPKTEIVRASELGERVIRRIYEQRNPSAMSEYRQKLKKYKRRLGKREEVTATKETLLGAKEVRGFYVKVYDGRAFVERPVEPKPLAYSYGGYQRAGGMSFHAQAYGLLAGPTFNRDMRPQRVDEYADEMAAGNWHDLLSDPISITTDGHVLNGQHRIAAAAQVDWAAVENDPSFLVVWGVDPEEALHADGSRRTARDEKTIASKLLAAA
jgi:hypothetical protein